MPLMLWGFPGFTETVVFDRGESMDTAEMNRERRFTGLPLSSGVAVAKVCLLSDSRHVDVPRYVVGSTGVERERQRFKTALETLSTRLDALIQEATKRIGRAEAEIFVAQKMIIEDDAVHAKVLEDIKQGEHTAEFAVDRVFSSYEELLLEVTNQYAQERASDIGEIKRRLLDVLRNTAPVFRCGNHDYCQRGRDKIVVVQELTPMLTMDLDKSQTLAFVTERGGAMSHAAILARALGIPAVSGIRDIHTQLSCGTEVLVDGNKGEVVAWPTAESLASYPSAATSSIQQIEPVEPLEGLTVMANISHAADVSEAAAMKAEGIGLYRTEFEFLAAGRPLTEDEQYERYATVLEAMDGKPVYFRLLDVGGDKSLPFLNLPAEENPHLGFRGARLLEARPDLLRPQARALARASTHGAVYVMYPMVVDLKQFLTLKGLFCRQVADLPKHELKHGVMFEVPGLCLEAREVFKHADFGSIGSNDLIQYLFAVDRNNERVAYDHSPDRAVFWTLLRAIAEAAAENRRPLSLCGELAGLPQYLPRLLEMNIRTLSVSARSIPSLRRAMGSVKLD
ncbi:MAG TPA: phosphoenolpyruvate--protein phosphotransferase [Candidatus Hydrogenedentes bacterium]|nr:phosphoenolpyruvate--protein phosphotransferase [Candidatus Hydrogenedentota bacterium]